MPLPDKDSAAAWGIPYFNLDPVTDPTTDLDANYFNQMACDVAMSTHTTTRAWVSFVTAAWSGGGPDAIAIYDHDAVWGSTPGVAPAVVHDASGRYSITWATPQLDELGGSHALNVRCPRAWCILNTAGQQVSVSLYTSNLVQVQLMSAAGANIDTAALRIFVEWR